MSKPNSCKYCAHRVECDKSYRRYIHEGTEHKCFYELKNDKMWSVIKHKSDCKFCEEAIVLSHDGKKVIAHYKCAIDNEDMSYGCKPGLCNYYEREKKSEVK